MRIRFCTPAGLLARYFTSFYLAEIEVPDGGRIVDHLHPEWGNLRFHSGALPEAENHAGLKVADTRFSATGPSSHAVRFSVGTTRVWGVGFMPLGWARFVPAPAADYADALCDGERDPVFAEFGSLAESLFGPEPDADAELARLTTWFEARVREPLADEARIHALHAALVDPEVGTVAELVRRTGASQSTVERLCRRAFGFSPKLLLLRQRFMRSLAHYMIDPSLKWIGVIDGHYHDQAQFVRDFHRFMGMSPSQYAATPHPILEAFVTARMNATGSPVQTLDRPRN
ncbi:MAG: helix-turn-helix domain-containing protein [Sphingomonadales bacterium]|nr:helix-turn-helix domain-containing protein [Sphingomonadales bacterium]